MSEELYEKALQVHQWGNRYAYLYRNMPAHVYNKIMTQEQGIMKTRLKDNGGDPNCVINGQLQGIWFCANVDNQTLEPKEPSPYGDKRLMIPVDYFLEQDVNLYFADFYCLKPNGPHYVVLVMTHPESEADAFCREENLIQLDHNDKDSNPFLYVLYNQTYVHSQIYVEVFYTEDIDVNEVLGQHDAVVTTTPVYNQGITWFNLPKNLACPKCNIE